MAEAMRILVTGFEPFGGAGANPALEAVRRLPAEVAGARVLAHALPVAFGRDAEELRGLVRGLRPDAVVCVGQAGGRSRITPEFVGINYALARIPDNDGARPRGVPVVPGGPDAYFATVPVHAMVERMRAAGISAAVSFSAGTFCCNEVLYALLHLCATEAAGVRGGFIHVPYAAEQAPELPAGTPTMPLGTMVRGLELALEAIVGHPEGDIEPVVGGTER